MPHKSQRRTALVPNPPWTTAAVVDAWDLIKDSIQPSMLPLLDRVKVDLRDKDRVVGRVHEYGCGAYGCVFPTHDPRIVMKVTTDATEAEFAAQLSQNLEQPIAVTYYHVVALNQFHEERRIYLLWRETADKVGEIGSALGARAVALINTQHKAAIDAYTAKNTVESYLKLQRARRAPVPGMLDHLEKIARRHMQLWINTCLAIIRQTEVPELHELGHGLMECYYEQRIFFGDVHDGNVGLVHRDDGGHWVITDPGHTSVIDPDLNI